MKKGQAAFEFVLYFSSFLLIFLIFVTLTLSNQQQMLQEKEELYAKQVTINFAEELNFATAIGDGYYKEYELPKKLLGSIDYEVRIRQDGFVLLNYTRGAGTFTYIYPVAATDIDVSSFGPLPSDKYVLIEESKKVKISFEGGELGVTQ